MAAQPTELSARLIDIFGNPLTADPTKLYGNLTVNPTGTVGIGTGLVMPDGYTMALARPGRNRIINGACRIQQLPSTAFATGASGFGGVDRFKSVNSASAGGSFTQSAATVAVGGVNKTFVVQTVGTAIASTATTNYWSGLSQNIEGYNAYDLLGQPITFSFWFYTNVTGTFSACMFDGTASQSYVTSFTAVAGVQKITLTTPALPTNLTVAANSTTYFGVAVGFLNTATYQTATLGSWQTGIFRSATGATNWGSTAGNYIGMSEVQLEPGLYATPFERRIQSDELLYCQRYYEVLNGGGMYGNGALNSTTVAYVWVPYVQKRTSTTLTGTAANTYYLYSPAVGTGAITSWTGAGNYRGAVLTVNVSGATSGQPCILEDAGGSAIYVNAEF